ncbi:tRNAse Z4, partial [Prunus dulcis]
TIRSKKSFKSSVGSEKEIEIAKEKNNTPKMTTLGGLIIILSSFLCLLLVLAFINILHKLWWTPIRIQKLMALQGIKGPSYRFIHGNTKEISNMKKEVMGRPHILSHDIFSVVQPHVHSWTNIYGKNYLQWHGSRAQLVITEP